MNKVWGFLINSILLGFGLAADAFSVSVVNGIRYPHMKPSRTALMAGTFSAFQALMPMGGWFLTRTLLHHFQKFRHFLPWVSQFFLLYLGIRMILDSKPEPSDRAAPAHLTGSVLLFQAVATSIDALLVGFTIAAYPIFPALLCALIIASVTLVLCFLGGRWGRALGLSLAGKASVLSGIILILIALEHFRTMLS